MADKTCVINVWNLHGWELDQDMLNAVMAKALQHLQQATLIDVYPQERVPANAPAYKHPGWLEWIIRIQYVGGGSLTIGCIQRTIGAKVEFHS